MDSISIQGQRRIFYLNNSNKVIYYVLNSSYIESKKFDFKKIYTNGELSEIVEVANGVVLKTNNSYLLYSSLKYLENVAKAPAVQNILTGLNPYGQSVFKKKSYIIQKMFNRLGIDEKFMDYKVESLKSIDSIIKKNNVSDDFIDQNYLGLYLYIGEVIKMNYGGDWDLEYVVNAPDDKFWLPVFIRKQGKYGLTLDNFLLDELESYEGNAYQDLLSHTYFFFSNP